jgi:hypothetical protein
VLWTNFVPDNPDPAETPQVDNRVVEQRWFSGAHANVGGGYQNDLLPQRPLAWLQGKAQACGLGFRSRVVVTDEEDLNMPVRDSYSEFLGGLWKILRFGKHYVRWVMSDAVRKEQKKASVETVNERIDLSVFRRCQIHSGYRPESLIEWKRRRNLDLEAIIAAPEKYLAYWSPVTRTGIESAIETTGAPSKQSG